MIQRFVTVVILLLYLLGFSTAKETDYAAIVNGVTINLSSFNKIFDESLADYRDFQISYEGGELDKSDIKSLKYSILDDIIENTIIESFAKENKISVKDHEIKAEIDALQKGFPNKETFWRALAEQNVNLKELAANFGENILKDKVMTYVHADYDKIVSEDIVIYLKKNKLSGVPLQYNVTLLVTSNKEYLEFIDPETLIFNWDELSVDKDLSFESLVSTEESLPSSVGQILPTLDMNIFSRVAAYDKDRYFIVRLNQIVNIPSFDLSSISSSIKDSLREEKKNKYFKEWLRNQKEIAIIKLNKVMFPEYNQYEENQPYFLDNSHNPPLGNSHGKIL